MIYWANAVMSELLRCADTRAFHSPVDITRPSRPASVAAPVSGQGVLPERAGRVLLKRGPCELRGILRAQKDGILACATPG